MKIIVQKKSLWFISILLILGKGYSQIQIANDIVGEAAADYSGRSLSLNDLGNIVAIGAPLNNNTNGADSGHVRVYEFNGTNWIQKGNDIDGEAIADHFGSSLSLNSIGNIVAIGTPDSDQNGSRSGHVKVYEWNGTSWVQKGNALYGQATNDRFGGSISLNSQGNILAIGEVRNVTIDNDYGRVKLYEWDGTNWTQKGSTLVGDEINDGFANSLSLNSIGNILAIGVPLSADNGDLTGKVKLYEWDDVDWVQKGNSIIGQVSDDLLGVSTSLNSSGNIIVIGASRNSNDNGNFVGQARIYEWNGNDWQQKGNNIYGEASSDNFGGSVSINSNGTKVVIGARNNDGNVTDNILYNCGHVRVYEWDGSNWLQRGIDIDGETHSENSGDEVSISADGNIVAIASTQNYSSSGYEVNAGIVKIFDISDSALNINDLNFERKIKVYPNPIQNRLYVELSDSISNPSIYILSNIGQIIISKQNSKANNFEFNFDDFSSGLYFIKIIDSKGNSYYKKLIKK